MPHPKTRLCDRFGWKEFNFHSCAPSVRVVDILQGQPRRMGAPNGAPVAPPSTISSTALTYEESSDARKSTALATSSGSPQRPSESELSGRRSCDLEGNQVCGRLFGSGLHFQAARPHGLRRRPPAPGRHPALARCGRWGNALESRPASQWHAGQRPSRHPASPADLLRFVHEGAFRRSEEANRFLRRFRERKADIPVLDELLC